MKVIAYTDGACSGNPGSAGYGVVLLDPISGTKKELCNGIGNATNNIAELSAVKAALLACKRPPHTDITICTDSTYVIGVLTNTMTARKNLILIVGIQEIMNTFNNVEFRHIKGHSGNKLNDIADDLAKAAAALT